MESIPNVFELYKMILEEWASYGPAMLLGVLTTICLFVWELVLLHRGEICLDGTRKLKLAEQRGHVVQGTLVDAHRFHQDRGESSNDRSMGVYRYTVDGITRRKRLRSTAINPPHEVTFYYVRNPRRVFAKSQVKEKVSPLALLIYIVPLLCGTGVYVILDLLFA